MTGVARWRNFHVPLPEALYDRLQREAARAGRPATDLARVAIAEALAQRRRRVLHDAIRAYATAHAGGERDLDTALEQAGIDLLLDES
jgi:hypothetical protein